MCIKQLLVRVCHSEGAAIDTHALGFAGLSSTIRMRSGHVVSFRDSKLTMLLRDSLGGGSLAIMLACVTPTRSASHESLRTLQFAMGVKLIRNKAVVLLNPQVSSRVRRALGGLLCRVSPTKHPCLLACSPPGETHCRATARDQEIA